MAVGVLHWRWLLPLTVGACLFLGAEPRALAEPTDSATYLKAARAAAKKGDWTLALEEYRITESMRPYNMEAKEGSADALFYLHRDDEAYQAYGHLLEALNSAMLTAPQRVGFKTRAGHRMEEIQARTGRLSIVIEGTGGDVFLDNNTSLGTVPVTRVVLVSGGTHKVWVAAANGERQEKTVEVTVGSEASVTMRADAPPIYPVTPPAAKPQPPSSSQPPPDVVETIGSPDVVESIGGPGTTVQVTPVASAPEDRFDLRGFARVEGQLGLASPHIGGGPPMTTSYSVAGIAEQFFVRAKYAHGRSFEGVVSGVLGHRYLWTKDVESGPGRRSSFEPALREAYVGLYSGRLDVRLGQQRIVWGETETFAPNDVWNPYDLRDPVLVDPELARVPVPAARLDLALGPVTLEGVVQPFFVPTPFDLYGTTWAAIQPDAPLLWRGFAKIVSSAADPSVRERVEDVFTATSLPKADLSGTSAGARVSWRGGRLAASAYYQYGYGMIPLVTADPRFAAAVAGADLSHAGLADFAPALSLIDAGVQPIDIHYVRRHHVGADVEVPAGPVTLRAAGAYETDSVFVLRDFTGIVRPEVSAVVAMEYLPGDVGKGVILEGTYQHVFDAPPAGTMLGSAPDGFAAAAVARWLLFEHLRLEVRPVVSIRPFGAFVRPQIGWQQGPFSLDFGVILLEGRTGSVAHYFRRNDEAYMVAKFVF